MAESPLQLVSEIGTELLQLTRFNKSVFLKLLKQAASVLSEIEQPATPETSRKQKALKELENATKPLRKSILKHGLIQKNDKDVRLFVVICVSEIFRILAPEPPFEDKYLREVFEVIVGIFKELGDITCPFFSRRVKILETVARCKCFVIMLDIDCNDLVLEMFNNFFSIVSERHQPGLVSDILSIMVHTLNEEPSLQLLEVVLQNLVRQEKGAPSAASQLAVTVIQSCAEKLQPFVCGFLTSCFLDRDATLSELRELYHEIMFKIFQCAPQMLLAVIPNLIQELSIDQVDIRIKALSLIAKLFALPKNGVAERYRDLFVEFLKRFSDKSPEVRMKALQCAKAYYLANPFGAESHEVLSALESRLLDFDDKVRTEAVIIACDLAKSNLKFPPDLIFNVTERLRDKRITVRKKALQKLLEVYQDYCRKCYEGRMTICDPYEEIPCKVMMLCYDKDCKEFRSQNVERILLEELFPILDIEERTRHWVHLFSLFEPLHMKALNSILSQKQRLRTEMRLYLSLRKKEKEKSPEETQKRIKSLFTKMSASFVDSFKAEECFQRLNKLKDNNIFNALDELLDELTIENAKATRVKLLKLVGEKHPDFDFLQLLSSKCMYIFDSDHVRCIVDGLSSNKFRDKQLEASVNLLLAIVSMFPLLLRGSEEKFLKLLKGNDMVNDKLIEVLAKAGSHISLKFSDIYPLLEGLCLEGTRVQSKSAVSAISSLSGTSQQLVFSNLCKRLVESLHRGWKIPTVLQSLGCIAQYSVSTFETQDEDITPYIYKNIIQVELLDDLASFNQTCQSDASCDLKIFGLKTLVKSFLPHRGSHVKRKIDELLNVLSKMLPRADTSDDLLLCESIRLAAAKSVLRLSRRWDLHISPEVFSSTISVVKDLSASARKSYLHKTYKLLKAHLLPSRYACAFAFAASDCPKDMRDDVSNYMEKFIKQYSIEARIRQNSAAQGVSITDYPAYVVVFLIHVLAHDKNFLLENFQDEGKIAKFFCPLFSILKALVNACIVDGDMDLVKDAILYLFCIFRAIKRAEDAVDAQKTPNLHVLANIGIAIVNELNHNGMPSSRAPGLILLPSSLYQISVARKSEEVSLKLFPQVSFEQSFVERVVHIFKSNFSLTARNFFPKRSQRRQVDSTKPAITYSEMDMVVGKQHDLPTFSAMESKNKHVRKETSARCNQKMVHSSTAHVTSGLLNKCFTAEECKNGAINSSALILEKGLLSSCDSVAMESITESQVSSQNNEIRADSLKENVELYSSIPAEPSKYSTAKFKDPCSSKTSYDSREVQLLCLDSEDCETIGGDSLSERDVLLQEDSKTIHLRNGNLKKWVDTFGEPAGQEQKTSSKQECGKFSGRTVPLAVKGKRGRKTLEEMSVSEVINLNDDVGLRRSQRQKVKAAAMV
ncbi:sister chromatid cohesion protein PDS5 homolog A isoform X2 [Mangifera indica]|uniref:sister chromatid cohesion protein PDS5 homolog A isoform X2 n=1 Tax=Mangifera indica TaxID=29780 RepID=UPI001CF9A1E3|nr:sister chromatid cohesion protein PDS5 homolog A isoform X2 [Mangifera indica]